MDAYIYYISLTEPFLLFYPFLVIFFLIITFFKNTSVSKIGFDCLFVMNTIILWVTIFNILIYLSELFVAWYGQNQYEWYAFQSRRAGFVDVRWSYALLIIHILMGLLFFFRTLRYNRVYLALFLLVAYNYTILKFFTGGTYARTGISFMGFEATTEIIFLLLNIAVVTIVYFIAKIKKRLPSQTIFA